MKLSIFLTILAISALTRCDPQAPVLASTFQENFHESAGYPIIGSGETDGKYFFDWTSKRSATYRNSGKWDRYCGSVVKFTDTPCTHYVAEGRRFLHYPARNECCMCCDATHGCGLIRPDWIVDGAYVNEYTDPSGSPIQVWNKKGFQNNFAHFIKGTNVWFRFENDKKNYMQYDIRTYKTTVEEKDIMLPSICDPSKLCTSFSVCGAIRSLGMNPFKGL